MNIAFYISNHGFGHIMRNLPVIAYLLTHAQDGVVLVTAEKQMELAIEYLEKETKLSEAELKARLITRVQEVDMGLIVKPGTLVIDEEATKMAVNAFTAIFPELIKGAKKLFQEYQIDHVVCDIAPWALTAAKDAGIDSVLMASFTWIEQYEDFLPESSIEPFRKCFADAQRVLFYELVNEPTRKRFPQGIDVGFCARPSHEDAVKEIKEKYGSRPIIFLSIGGSNSGIEGEIDVSGLPYNFISTEGLNLIGDNVHFLPVHVENTQDYVVASDYCISKAGWSTISEIMLAGNPVALLERPDVPEDRMNIEELVKRGVAISIGVEELDELEMVFNKMKTIAWRNKAYANNVFKISNLICNSIM